VVGGSRGLGEVVAKLLGGGGADVVVTYAQGRAEAERVAADIAGAGGRARALRLDVLDAAAARAALADGSLPTLLAYFASPFIGSGGRAFSPAQFQRFCSYYVDGFVHVAEAILARSPERLSILYPSSEFVTTRPANMAEYAAAKAAGEVACEQLAQRRAVRVHCPRIGKLGTDQTQSLLSVDSGDPVPPMLAALRQLSLG